MIYFVIVSIILIAIFLIIYPFKITIYNEDNYLYLSIAKLVNLKLNLFLLFDNNHQEDIKKQVKGIRVLKKVTIKELDFDIKGLNFNYQNGAYYGIICAIFGFFNQLCKSNEINFNYNLEYLGDKSIEFKGIIRARLIQVITGFYGI